MSEPLNLTAAWKDLCEITFADVHLEEGDLDLIKRFFGAGALAAMVTQRNIDKLHGKTEAATILTKALGPEALKMMDLQDGVQ